MTNETQPPSQSVKLLAIGLIAWTMLSTSVPAGESSSLGKYLLLDSRLIEKTEGVELRVGKVTKHPANPLFGEDKPWEVCINNGYPNLMFDEEEGIYKCWYNPFIVDPAVSKTPETDRERVTYMEAHRKLGGTGGREFGLCYATSRDGLKWEKPLLPIVKWNGEPSNILLRRFPGQERSSVEKGPHGCTVIKDPDEKDPARRYKMVLGPGLRQTAVSFSPDGIHWSIPRRLSHLNIDEPAYTIARMPTADRFAIFCRRFDIRENDPVRKVRVVSRFDTEDFKTWSAPQVVFACKDRTKQAYIMPVFYYHGVYLGLPAIFDIVSDKVHTELTWSPDTVKWHRIDPGNPLIPNSTTKGNPEGDWGCIYPPSSPVFLKDEIRLYYASSDGLHYGWRKCYLNLAVLRPDGFAGYETTKKDEPGMIVAREVDVSGSMLHISAEVDRGGWIRAEVADDRNRTFLACRPITETVTDGRIHWQHDRPLTDGKIALRFKLKNAKLYSFSFK